MKRAANARQIEPPRRVDYQQRFLKNWRRLVHAGIYDLYRLKQVMLLLIANDGPLGPEWRDHALKGNWADCRECHVGGDFLLIYQVSERSISFILAGSHAQLLEM